MADGEGEGGPPAAAAALKDQGNEQFKAGSYLKAAALYTQAIKLDPDNATLYRFLPLLFLLGRAGGRNPSCACARPAFGGSDGELRRGRVRYAWGMKQRTRAPAACVITDQCFSPAVLSVQR
jgi:tetratricopeptide (TPR) repeat protein